MIIAIVSDTHDNMANFSKVIGFLNMRGIATMLHCGDICNQATIDEAEKKFDGEIKFIRGNGDFGLYEVPEKMELTLGEKRIFLNHYPDIAKIAAESGKYDLVFYGHTHRPWLEEVVSPSTGSGRVCRLVNPGEVAGQRYKPTFALYDTETEKLELKILEQL